MPANEEYFIPTTSGLSDLDLPSGGKVQVRMLGIEDLVELGILDQMDMFGSLVQTEHVDRVKGGPKKPGDRQPKKLTKAQTEEQELKAVTDLMKDKEKFGPMSQSIDRVISFAILKPSVKFAFVEVDGKLKKIDLTMRDEGQLYSDNLGLEDKMHVFGFVLPGGEAMKPFRQGRIEAVGDVEDVSEDAGSA